jgi:hypothetical protein
MASCALEESFPCVVQSNLQRIPVEVPSGNIIPDESASNNNFILNRNVSYIITSYNRPKQFEAPKSGIRGMVFTQLDHNSILESLDMSTF